MCRARTAAQPGPCRTATPRARPLPGSAGRRRGPGRPRSGAARRSRSSRPARTRVRLSLPASGAEPPGRPRPTGGRAGADAVPGGSSGRAGPATPRPARRGSPTPRTRGPVWRRVVGAAVRSTSAPAARADVDAEMAHQLGRVVGLALGRLVEQSPGRALAGPRSRVAAACSRRAAPTSRTGGLPPWRRVGALVAARRWRAVGVGDRQQVRSNQAWWVPKPAGPVREYDAPGERLRVRRAGSRARTRGRPAAAGRQPEPVHQQRSLEGSLVGPADVAQAAGVAGAQVGGGAAWRVLQADRRQGASTSSR